MNPPTFTYDTLTWFPLRWRWTRASHDVFTADELACVHPLDEASARLAHAHVRELRDTGRGSRERTIELDEAHREDVRGWLDRLGVTPGTPVVLSWSATI